MHKGEWAIHEVLPSLLCAIGEADVRIATFSVSEDSLRPLFFLTDETKIRSLTLLLDHTVKRHKLDLLLFAANITPISVSMPAMPNCCWSKTSSTGSASADLPTSIRTTDGKPVSGLPPVTATTIFLKPLTRPTPTLCPMQLSDEQLQQVEEMAAALLPPSEIAILIRIDADQRDLFCEICKNHTASDIYTAYHRGRLQTKYELRKTVIKLAKAGSPAAEPLADKYMKEQNIQE